MEAQPRELNIDAKKMDLIRRFAHADALVRKVPVPVVDGLSTEESSIVFCRFMASSNQYLPGDANLDNQKRNVTIRLFLEYSVSDLRNYGRQWLNRWRDENGLCLWFKEWDRLVNFGSDDELIRTLLSADEEATRQRLSKPFSGLLEPEVVLKIKQSGMPI